MSYTKYQFETFKRSIQGIREDNRFVSFVARKYLNEIKMAEKEFKDNPYDEETERCLGMLYNYINYRKRRHNKQLQVFEHLKEHRTITRDQANELYHTGSIMSIIFRLRDLGYKIKTETNRSEAGKRYTVYVYCDEQKTEQYVGMRYDYSNLTEDALIRLPQRVVPSLGFIE